MKKSQSAPSLCGNGSTSTLFTHLNLKRNLIRRNAYSLTHMYDIDTISNLSNYSSQIENIEYEIPAPILQKGLCIGTYGFPSEILHDTSLSNIQKQEKLKDLITCMITPDEPDNKRERPGTIINRYTNTNMEQIKLEYYEERFQRLLFSIRKNRKGVNRRATIEV